MATIIEGKSKYLWDNEFSNVRSEQFCKVDLSSCCTLLFN